MPMIERSDFLLFNAHTKYCEISHGKFNDPIMDCHFLALIKLSPLSFWWIVLADLFEWKKYYVGDGTWSRIRLLQGPNTAIMLKAMRAKQWRWCYWVRWLGFASTFLIIFIIIIICELGIMLRDSFR